MIQKDDKCTNCGHDITEENKMRECANCGEVMCDQCWYGSGAVCELCEEEDEYN